MKLAEALLLRSDLQTKLASLQQRINNNVLIQEGDELSEDPNALMGEAFSVNTELHHLIEKFMRPMLKLKPARVNPCSVF
jgi:hypothetical protein